MNMSREEKQVEKISKLQQELEKTRKRIKSLECKLSTSERKRETGEQKCKTLMAEKKRSRALYPCDLSSDINILNL
jgi:chromosome segregation ATPase